MNKTHSGDPPQKFLGRNRLRMAAVSILTHSLILLSPFLGGCGADTQCSWGLMGPTKGVAINFLNIFLRRTQPCLVYMVRSLTLRPFLEIFALQGVVYRSYSCIYCVQSLFGAFGKMQIEGSQTQSFSFIRLEARPGDFNCPVSLWIILSEALV